MKDLNSIKLLGWILTFSVNEPLLRKVDHRNKTFENTFYNFYLKNMFKIKSNYIICSRNY